MERVALKGREQEWNISRKELAELVSPPHSAPSHMLGHDGAWHHVAPGQHEGMRERMQDAGCRRICEAGWLPYWCVWVAPIVSCFPWSSVSAHVEFCIAICICISMLTMAICCQAEQGILSQADAESCISSEFNPIRAGFHGHKDVWTSDVLNLGVRPDWIIEKVQSGTLPCHAYPWRVGPGNLGPCMCTNIALAGDFSASCP